MAQIKTNNQPRDLLHFCDFTEAEQQQIRQDFDWMTAEDLECNFGFFKYMGQIVHLQSFSSTYNCPTSFEGWDGFLSHTYFSGWLIKLTPDCDQVICAHYSS